MHQNSTSTREKSLSRSEKYPKVAQHAGRPVGITNTTIVVPEGFGCKQCGSSAIRVHSKHIRKDGTVHRGLKCKECGFLQSEVSSSNAKRRRTRTILNEAATHKTCSLCRRMLEIGMFSKRSKDVLLFNSACNECRNRDRAIRQERETLKRFGLINTTYNELAQKQGGVCAICKLPGRGKGAMHQPLCFDHCHETGLFRGLLCDQCNQGIGCLGDSLSRVRAAVEYLENFSQRKEVVHD